MISPSQDSYPTPENSLRSKATEQEDIISQTQSELLELIRVTPDEALESWQKPPIRLGEWSNTLESEICRFLW